MTAIAALWKDDEIVIAADSRVYDFDNNIGPDANKILDFGQTFLCSTGLAWHGATGYNVRKKLRDIAPNLLVTPMADAVENVLFPGLADAIRYMRDKEAKKFEVMKAAPLRILLAGLEFGRPKMLAIQTTFQEDGRLRSDKILPPFLFPGQRICLLVGTTEGQKQYQNDWNAQNLNRRSLVEFARDFVQMEIDKKLARFGGPIDILRITPSGPEWIQGKPAPG